MAARIAPMLAQLKASLPSGPDWIYEIKLDGQRTVAEVAGDHLVLYTRTFQDVTLRYPELAGISRSLKCKSAVLDGEIVALKDGIPSFELLQQRMNRRSPGILNSATASIPILYYVFDLLEVNGASLLDLPLMERRKRLQKIVKAGESMKVLPYFDSNDQILERAKEFGYEGLMIKRRQSLYRPGRRTDDWIKFKFQQYGTFLICGWTEGGRVRNFGALVLGKYHGRGKYAHIGQVGTGFTERTIHMLMSKLEILETGSCPFIALPKIKEKVHWTKPALKAEIKFKEWTRAEILRSPVYVRLVDGK